MSFALRVCVLYACDHRQVAITDADGTRYARDPKRIAVYYLTGWFPIDVLSIAVSSVDYVTISTGGGATGDLDNLRTLRVLRALRLIKLSKLITGQRIIKRWETKVRAHRLLITPAHLTG